MLYERLTNSQKTYYIKEIIGIDFSKVTAVRVDILRKTVSLDTFTCLKDIINFKTDFEDTRSMLKTQNTLIDYYEEFEGMPLRVDPERFDIDFSKLKDVKKTRIKNHNLRIVGE